MLKLNRNQMFYLYIAVGLVVLLVIYGLAEKQNQGFWEDYVATEQVVKLLAENQTESAGEILDDLLPRHPESFQLNWYYGIYLAEKKEYRQAQQHYDRAVELAPDLMADTVFLWRYGKNLFYLGELEQAKGYLEICSSRVTDPEIKAEVDQLLSQIQNGA
jgi:tetratricopeptide (TPR) repeat protein